MKKTVNRLFITILLFVFFLPLISCARTPLPKATSPHLQARTQDDATDKALGVLSGGKGGKDSAASTEQGMEAEEAADESLHEIGKRELQDEQRRIQRDIAESNKIENPVN